MFDLSSFRATAVAAAVIFVATPAFAHARLLTAEPAPNAMAMPMPAALTLSFSEALEPAFTKVVVTGPNHLPLAPVAEAVQPDRKTLVVTLPGGLQGGLYTVAWTAVCADGHKTTGSYSYDAMK